MCSPFLLKCKKEKEKRFLKRHLDCHLVNLMVVLFSFMMDDWIMRHVYLYYIKFVAILQDCLDVKVKLVNLICFLPEKT